jgi:hypothetical protein
VNASALPKVRVNGDEFLAWSQRRPDDVDTKFLDDFTAASIRRRLALFVERRAVVRCQRNRVGTSESPIVENGETAVDPPGISVCVAALLGS